VRPQMQMLNTPAQVGGVCEGVQRASVRCRTDPKFTTHQGSTPEFKAYEDADRRKKRYSARPRATLQSLRALGAEGRDLPAFFGPKHLWRWPVLTGPGKSDHCECDSATPMSPTSAQIPGVSDPRESGEVDAHYNPIARHQSSSSRPRLIRTSAHSGIPRGTFH